MKAENRKSNDKLRTEKKKKRSKTVTEQLHKLCQRQCFLLTIFLFFSSIQHLSNGNLSQTVSTPLSQQCFHLLQSLFVLKSVFFSQFFFVNLSALCQLPILWQLLFLPALPGSFPVLSSLYSMHLILSFGSISCRKMGQSLFLVREEGKKIPNVPFHYTSKGTS